MLKYLIIPLTRNAVSFCHYSRNSTEDTAINVETLKKGIVFAMKENLNIQFLYPDYEISEEHKNIIDSIDHTSIVSSTCEDRHLVNGADIIVFDSWASLNYYPFEKDKSYVIRTDKKLFFDNAIFLKGILKSVDRLVVVLTDPQDFSNEDFRIYTEKLNAIIPVVKEEYRKGHIVHFNLLTDRMLIDGMNNCNAGHESITLAPDGNFYICPAFYLDGSTCVGNIETGLDIKNPLLYHLNHAPICKICDAYQCRRCVWLNKKTTGEVNTPSHEQCVISHIERNASKRLLESIREIGEFLPEKNISGIDYLDPFDKLTKQQTYE